jgi:hypothetical protein
VFRSLRLWVHNRCTLLLQIEQLSDWLGGAPLTVSDVYGLGENKHTCTMGFHTKDLNSESNTYSSFSATFLAVAFILFCGCKSFCEKEWLYYDLDASHILALSAHLQYAQCQPCTSSRSPKYHHAFQGSPIVIDEA